MNTFYNHSTRCSNYATGGGLKWFPTVAAVLYQHLSGGLRSVKAE